MGFDAAVIEQVERRSGLKRWAGHPLFVCGGVATWFRHYDRSRPGFSVEFKDGETIADGYLAICQNTNPYTFLGNRPLNLNPAAALERPLTLATFRRLDPITVLGVIASAAGFGPPLGRFRRLVRRDDLDGFTLHGNWALPYQVDGDHLGTAEEFVFRYEPEALGLVMPRA